MSLVEDVTALRVKPGEVLIVKVTEESGVIPTDVVDALVDAGLAGRALVVYGDVELAVVEKTDG